MIVWQDMVLAIGGFVFAFALVPSIGSKDKPALKTSVITSITLLVFCVCYATLGLWLAFTSTVVTAALWIILAIQKGGEKWNS